MAASLNCPQCQHHDVRASRRRPFDVPLGLLGLYPYRCRNCNHRFYRRDAETDSPSHNGDSELKRILSELPPPSDGVIDAAKPALPAEATSEAPEEAASEDGTPPPPDPPGSKDLLKKYSVKPHPGTSKADPEAFPDDYPWDHKWSREE